MTPKLKPLTYREQKFVDALFTCSKRISNSKGTAARAIALDGSPAPAGGAVCERRSLP